jgi:hypothetical protein
MFHCVTEALTLTRWEGESLLRIKPPIGRHLAGSLFPAVWGAHPVTREVKKKNGLWVPNEPPEMLWDSWTERGHWGSSTGNNILLCRHRLSGLLSKDWASRTKCFALYTLSSTVQKWETKLNPYMVVCYFYWLLYPQYYITLFRSSFLKFQFAAMLSPPPHYILSWCHV